MLKIVTVNDFNANNRLNTSYLSSLRLRGISYDYYKDNIKNVLISQKYSGNIIIDYPHNLNWKEHYHGVHFASNDLYKFNPNKNINSSAL